VNLIRKLDLAYTTAVLQCSDDIVFDVGSKLSENSVIVNDDRKSWPASKVLPDRGAVCAEKLEVKTER
jgi:hypothetical protein